MKSLFSALLTGVICLLLSSSINAQTTYTSGGLTVVSMPSMTHDSGTCQSTYVDTFVVTVNSSFTGDSIMIVDTAAHTLQYLGSNITGTSPWTITIPMIGYIRSDGGLPATGGIHVFNQNAYKVISGTDTLYTNAQADTFYVGNPCSFGTLTGYIYADMNGNCILDTADIHIAEAGKAIAYTENLSGPVPTISYIGYSLLYGYGTYYGGSGQYTAPIQTSWMTDFTLSLQPYFTFIFPQALCAPPTYTFTTLPGIDVNFPVLAPTNVDVSCWAGGPGNARPNRPFYLQPTVNNLGFDSISGQLTLIKDNRVAYDATLSTYPADTVHGDTLIWNYYNLTCISDGAYWNNFMSGIHLTPNTTVNIGDTLCFRIFTGVPATDINPANNDYTICLPVVNSYDPNIKEVSPKGEGPAGEIGASTPELEYTIHFQNTGTDFAYDVNIIDTLSANVDAGSLKILGTSHTMEPEWIAPGVVKFKFANIYLADSFSNEPASHGYVRFKVKMHSGLTPGTQIKNKGYIYFDFNPPVITNEALNTIIHTVSVPVVATPVDVKVYPNPATENIFVENLQNGQLTILSMNGSVVLTRDITTAKTEIDLSRLPAGVYILKTVSKDGATTRKFVKQ